MKKKNLEKKNKIYGEYYNKIFNIKQFDQIIKSLFLLKDNKIIRQNEYIKKGKKFYTNTGCKTYFIYLRHILRIYMKYTKKKSILSNYLKYLIMQKI